MDDKIIEKAFFSSPIFVFSNVDDDVRRGVGSRM